MTALKLPDGTVCHTGPTCRLHGNLHTLQEQVYAAYEAAQKKAGSVAVDLTKKTPVEIDGKLAELYADQYAELSQARQCKDKLAELNRLIEHAQGEILSAAQRRNKQWVDSGVAQKDVDYYERLLTEAETKADLLAEKMQPYHDEYERRGGWTRAFWVSNAGGHVHKSMNCSTCYPTTRFQWLTSYSGKDENEIVGDAGQRACTVCYSSAPVDLLRRPSKINDPEKEAARQEREAKKVAKEAAAAAKGIKNPDGSKLYVNGWEVKTERTAESEAVNNFVDVEREKINPDHYPNKEYLAERKQDAENVLVALAHKHGTTVEEERQRITPKIAKKVREIQRIIDAQTLR